MGINIKGVLNVLGALLIGLGSFMFLVLLFCFFFDADDRITFLQSGSLTISVGAITWWLSRHASKKIGKREGYLIVGLGWLTISIFSCLPYLFSATMENFTDAFFESVSGLTTTGASIINDLETTPKGILLWRSLTQWFGGMGIIVLTVALFPLLGIGGVELFIAESPGPTSDKIHPRIKETAKRLWFIYVGLTALLTITLFLVGMTFFDAINHALTTLSSGGFSTKNESVAFYDIPVIQYIIAFFMFLTGINYTLIYYGLKGRFNKVWKSDEFKAYLFVMISLIIVVTSAVYYLNDSHFEQAFRDSTFQVISIVTTTGFVTADYTSWSPTLTFLFFLLLFIGACAGSTSGGIKIIRHLVFLKNSILEFKRLLHPRGVIRTKIDEKVVAPRILTHILVFLILYLLIFMVGSSVMTFILRDFEQPFLSSIGAVATSLGNVGPGIGHLGPLNNFAGVPAAGKWFLSLLMIIGRLELFTILILFTPYFWRAN